MVAPTPDVPESGPRPDRGALWVGAAVLAVVGAGVPLLLAAHYGALGIPRSDDWSYLATLFRLVDSGSLSFNHWVSMSLVGQLVLAAPVAAVTGRDITPLQVLTALEGVVGLVLVTVMVRRGGSRSAAAPGRWAGLVLALTIALGPLWGPLAASFMTDVPTFAVTVLAMTLAVEAFRRASPSWRWLAASLVVALAAFTIRQYALVALLAGGLTGLWAYASAGDRRRALRLLALFGVLLVLAIAFLAWWRTVPDVRSLAPTLPDAHSVRVTVVKGAGFLRLLGLLLLPVLVYAGPLRLVRRSWRASAPLTVLVGGAVAVALAAVAWRVPLDLFVGNYLMANGVLAQVVLTGRRPDVLPGPVWDAIVWVATAAAVVLAIAVVPVLVGAGRRMRARDWRLPAGEGHALDAYLALTVLGYGAAYGLAAFTGLQVYDRYVLGALPAVGLLLLRGRRPPAGAEAPARGPGRGGRVATGLALAGLAVVGLAFSADSASFDGARWRVAVAATRQGWDVRQVNGGFEWINYQRGEKLELRQRPARATGTATAGTAPAPVLCVTVQINPRRVRTRVVAVVESTAPTRRPARLVALRTPRPCRPRHATGR